MSIESNTAELEEILQMVNELPENESNDTGWIALTLVTGVIAGSQDGAVAPRGRVKDGVLYLNGNFKGVEGKAAGFTNVATLPETLKNAIVNAGDISTVTRFAMIYDRYYVIPGVLSKNSSGEYLLHIGSQRYNHTHTVAGDATDSGTYNGKYNTGKEFSLGNSICLG